jgi:hypothetical protein
MGKKDEEVSWISLLDNMMKIMGPKTIIEGNPHGESKVEQLFVHYPKSVSSHIYGIAADFAQMESKIMIAMLQNGTFIPISLDKEEEDMAIKGMSVNELIYHINNHRSNLNLPPIHFKVRDNSTPNLNIRTSLIMCGDICLAKATHAGSLNWFLKGMLQAFLSEKIPMVDTKTGSLITQKDYERKVELD